MCTEIDGSKMCELQNNNNIGTTKDHLPKRWPAHFIVVSCSWMIASTHDTTSDFQWVLNCEAERELSTKK